MTTYIEILDTAVKIGLAAAITGVATYWVMKLKGQQNARTEAIKNNRTLIEKLALGVEESANTLTKIVLILYGSSGIAEEKAQRVKEAQGLYLKVYESVNNTEAIATLVGNTELQQKLGVYADIVSEFHDFVRFNPEDFENMDKVINRLNVARNELRNAIRDNYEMLSP